MRRWRAAASHLDQVTTPLVPGRRQAAYGGQGPGHRPDARAHRARLDGVDTSTTLGRRGVAPGAGFTSDPDGSVRLVRTLSLEVVKT